VPECPPPLVRPVTAMCTAETPAPLPAVLRWTWQGRLLVFALSATSIWCLLAEFYGLCSMRTFTFAVLLPATLALIAGAFLDRLRGDGELWRGVVLGAFAGLAAACAYDLFRLPFVFSREWGLSSVVPALDLFKVFPRFGAMILGEPAGPGAYSPAARLTGWAYHFSNGVTFGVMYVALIGDARRRPWLWAVALAAGLELGMLLTPYPGFFGIPLTGLFVAVTLAAHLVFGVVLGLWTRWWARALYPSDSVPVASS
jgi:hypothetical protein